MNKLLLTLLFVSTFTVQALDLFKAEYDVYKGGKKIGLSSIELTSDAPFYSLANKTNGTHGMASFLGFKRTESTLFTYNDDQFQIESYQMKQKVAFNKRQSEYQIDKQSKMVYGNHKGKDWQSKTPTVFSTPNLVSLNLSQDICKDKKLGLDYQVLKDAKIKGYNFKIVSEKNGVIEIDRIHSKPSRITKTWLDTNQQCLPVRTYHIEDGEDPVETKLIKITFL